MMQNALEHARETVERGGLDASFKSLNAVMAGTLDQYTDQRT